VALRKVSVKQIFQEIRRSRIFVFWESAACRDSVVCMGSTNRDRNNVPQCVVRLDRLILTVRTSEKMPTITGYRVVKDSRVRQQGAVPTYERTRQLENSATGSKIYIQYRPLQGFLPDKRITMVGDDELGITVEEIVDLIRTH
jgi:hypothetical protein